MFGTMGYAAPEALGYYDENDNTITYTVSVDIWAVGVIALTLLLGREVFPRQGDLSRYINGQRQLDFSRAQGDPLTDSCRDFVLQMLAPDPVIRPTAIAALAHPWLNNTAAPPSDDAGTHGTQHVNRRARPSHPDARYIKQEPRSDSPPAVLPDATHQTQPDKKRVIKSETEAKLKLSLTKDPITLQRMHNFLSLDSVLLTPKLRDLLSDQVATYLPTINTTTECVLGVQNALTCSAPLHHQNRYFVLRSNNATDIETSAALDVWTSSARVNKILDKAYGMSGGHVVMFFSVILRYVAKTPRERRLRNFHVRLTARTWC